MTAVLMTPIVLSFVLLAAHFLRDANMIAVALCLAAPLLMIVRRAWVARLLQALLAAGGIVWIMTLLRLVMLRVEQGQPWLRLALILGTVALVTGLSALLFQTRRMKARFALARTRHAGRPADDGAPGGEAP